MYNQLSSSKKYGNFNPSAVSAAASIVETGVDLANIATDNYANLKFDGYKATGAAAGASLGASFGPIGMGIGAVAGTAYDIWNFGHRKQAFNKQKKVIGIRDWQTRINSLSQDNTGQFYQ